MIQYYNNIIDNTYPLPLETSSFKESDFKYGYFIIFGTEYKEYNEAFLSALEKFRIWDKLTP